MGLLWRKGRPLRNGKAPPTGAGARGAWGFRAGPERRAWGPEGATGPGRPRGGGRAGTGRGGFPARPPTSKQPTIPNRIELGPGATEDPVVRDQPERARRRRRGTIILGLDQDMIRGDFKAASLGPDRRSE